MFSDIPGTLPFSPKWVFVDQRMSKHFGVREVWYDFKSDSKPIATIKCMIEYIRLSLDEHKTLILANTSERDYVRLVLVSDQLNVPILTMGHREGLWLDISRTNQRGAK